MSSPSRVVPSVLVLVLAPFAFAQEAAPAQKHLLRMAHAVGKPAFYCQSTQMTSKVKMGERDVEMQQSTSMWYSATATKVEGGKATIEQAYLRVKAKAGGMMNAEFDSADPESDGGALRQLEDLVGESITLVMDDRGGVSETKPSAGFPQRVLEQSGSDLENVLSQFVPQFPDQPIAIGEAWTTEMSLPMGQMGTAVCSITNKLTAIDKGIARVEQSYTIDTSSVQLPGGTKMESEGGAGFTNVDLATGYPVDSENRMTMRVQGGPNGLTMQMTMFASLKRAEEAEAKGVKKAEPAASEGKAK